MDARPQPSIPYFMLDDAQHSYAFYPLEFDLQGVLAGYQANPLLTYNLSSFLWGPIIRDHYTIYYIAKGSGVLTVNSREFNAKAGQLLVTYPSTMISEFTESSDPWEYYWVHLKSSHIASFLQMLGVSEKQPVFNSESLSDALPLFKQLVHLTPSNTPEDIFQRVSLVSQIFRLLFQKANCIKQNLRTSDSNTYVLRALNFFELNLQNKISVNMLAQSLGLSRSHFSRIFKEQMGFSPQEYIIRFKVKKACEFLLLPNVSIASVAASLGYDQFTFSRVFKHIMGLSPSEYQKNHSKNPSSFCKRSSFLFVFTRPSNT